MGKAYRLSQMEKKWEKLKEKSYFNEPFHDRINCSTEEKRNQMNSTLKDYYERPIYGY